MYVAKSNDGGFLPRMDAANLVPQRTLKDTPRFTTAIKNKNETTAWLTKGEEITRTQNLSKTVIVSIYLGYRDTSSLFNRRYTIYVI